MMQLSMYASLHEYIPQRCLTCDLARLSSVIPHMVSGALTICAEAEVHSAAPTLSMSRKEELRVKLRSGMRLVEVVRTASCLPIKFKNQKYA